MSTQHKPVVSVLTTVYNGQEHLAEAIQSIINQTFTDFEFLIIDDGSDDSTPEILAAAAEDPRIQVFSFPRTVHRAKMLNFLLRESQGEYIAILDADDVAYPERLAKQVEYLRAHPQIGLVGGAVLRIDERSGKESIVSPPTEDAQLRSRLMKGFPIVHSTIMAPAAVMKSIGGYNEDYFLSEDYELYFRIAKEKQLACLPDVLIKKRGAGFFAREGIWKRQKLVMKIRRYGWRALSRPLPDLYYVWGDPLVQTTYRVIKNNGRV